MEENQQNLFDIPREWEEEWEGMTEFDHKNLQPKKSIIVHFRSDEDFNNFIKLIGQRLTEKTKSVWYPEVTIETYMDKRYIQEPNREP